MYQGAEGSPVCWSADSWAGVDRAVPFKLRVSETTRAEREGRAGKGRGQVLGDEAAAEDREGDEEDEDEEDEEEGVEDCVLESSLIQYQILSGTHSLSRRLASGKANLLSTFGRP